MSRKPEVITDYEVVNDNGTTAYRNSGPMPGAMPDHVGSAPRVDIQATTRELLNVRATDIASRAFGRMNVVDRVRDGWQASTLNRQTSGEIKKLLADELIATYKAKIQMMAEGIRGHAVMEANSLDNKLHLIITEGLGNHLLNLNEKLADTVYKASLDRQTRAHRNRRAFQSGFMGERAFDLAEDLEDKSYARAVTLLQNVIDAFSNNIHARVLQIVSNTEGK